MGPLVITPEFSLANARVCLEASQYVYDHDCGIDTGLFHGAMLDCGNARLLACRGSMTARDWLTDFECLFTNVGPGEEMHHGFWDAVQSARAQVLALARAGTTPLFVTGHSLGGADAVALAWLLQLDGTPVQSVYTFGGPRTGNRGWAQSYDALLGPRTFRVVNEEDIVPRVPGWLAGYRHVGQEVFLPSLGGMRMNPPLWYKALSDGIGTYLDWKQGRIAQLVDHASQAYGARLDQLAAKLESTAVQLSA